MKVVALIAALTALATAAVPATGVHVDAARKVCKKKGKGKHRHCVNVSHPQSPPGGVTTTIDNWGGQGQGEGEFCFSDKNRHRPRIVFDRLPDYMRGRQGRQWRAETGETLVISMLDYRRGTRVTVTIRGHGKRIIRHVAPRNSNCVSLFLNRSWRHGRYRIAAGQGGLKRTRHFIVRAPRHRGVRTNLAGSCRSSEPFLLVGFRPHRNIRIDTYVLREHSDKWRYVSTFRDRTDRHGIGHGVIESKPATLLLLPRGAKIPGGEDAAGFATIC